MNATARPLSITRIPWLELGILFLGSRLLIILIAWLSLQVVVPGEFFEKRLQFTDVFMGWDAGWYSGIATDGYSYVPGQQSTVAFFPLYPLLIRCCSLLTGSTAMSGFILSNIALFGAMVLLWRLVEDMALESDGPLKPGDGSRTTRLLLFGPVSFFHSILYSESLFLLLLIASFYAARRRTWWLAGLLGYAAALTRNAGMLLVVPLLAEYFEVQLRAPYFRRNVSWLRASLCLLPVLGFLTWATYLASRFGDPFLVVNAQSAWARKLDWPWVSLLRGLDWPWLLQSHKDSFYFYWFKGHALIASILFAYCFVARLRLSLVLLAGVLLLLNFSASHLEAIPRLTSVIFPFYIAGAVALRRWPQAEVPVIGLSAALLSLSTLLFVNGYWFT